MITVAEVKPRRRSATKHQSILSAAAQVALDVGYAASTIELIATQAGVGKQTIYRWWPSKAALFLETYKYLVSDIAMPSSNYHCKVRLRRFLAALFRRYSQSSAGIILSGLIGEMANNPDVRNAVKSGLLLERSSIILDPIRDGVEKGEVILLNRAEDCAEVVVALIWKQLLVEPQKLNARFAKHTIEVALGGE